MKDNIWGFIWWLSETFKIPLGKFAPFIFGKMIGKKGKRINKEKKWMN